MLTNHQDRILFIKNIEKNIRMTELNHVIYGGQSLTSSHLTVKLLLYHLHSNFKKGTEISQNNTNAINHKAGVYTRQMDRIELVDTDK